jgi:hypothetical protein
LTSARRRGSCNAARFIGAKLTEFDFKPTEGVMPRKNKSIAMTSFRDNEQTA